MKKGIFFTKLLNKTRYLTRFKSHRSGVMGQESVVKGHDQGLVIKGQRSRVSSQRSAVKPFSKGATGEGLLVRVKGHWTQILDL